MQKIWSFEKKLKPIKGIGSKPNMTTSSINMYENKLVFILVNQGGDTSLVYEFDPLAMDADYLYEEGGFAKAAPIENGKIYFLRNRNYRCLDLVTKSITFEHTLEYLDADPSFPLISGNDLIFGTVKGIVCANKLSGEKKWMLDLAGKYGVHVNLLNGKIITSQYKGKVQCINQSGEILWTSKMDSKYAAVYDNMLVLTDEKTMYVLDGETGKLIASHNEEEDMYNAKAISGGFLCNTSKYTIEEEKVTKLWQLNLKGNYIATGVLEYDNMLLFFDNKKNFYKVNVENGDTIIKKVETVKKISSIFINDNKMYVFGKNLEIDCFEL